MNTQEPNKAEKAERFALKLSIAGMLAMAVLGFGFAAVTESHAIFLDGVFSLIGLIISILTLMIAKLVVSDATKKFQFGFAHFEPLWNSAKSMIIIAICVFAMADAISDLLQGGRVLKFGLASIYALVATVGCLLIAWSMNRFKGTTDSTLVDVDVKAWLVDTYISAAILLGFVVVYFIQDTRWNVYLPYVDSSLVVVLVLISLPIPIKILKENMREVLLRAPAPAVQDEIHSRLRAATKGHNIKDTKVRITKLGRYIQLNTYVIVDETFEVSSIKELDDIREKIDEELSEYHPKIVSDIIFTEDKKWSE